MENNVDHSWEFYDEDFRDHLATVDKEGKRIWIYPKKPSGKLFNYRAYLSYFLLLVLFALPWININGNPIFLLNILERKFVLFGIAFYPQDFHIFFFLMITFIVFIILFTVIFGRLFCGWVCPQTLFMEMVFRRIEYWIEGDANAQVKLNKEPWTSDKMRKKTMKHFLFFVISSFIAHTFLSYIIGVDRLLLMMREGIGSHFGLFASLLLFTAVFYGVFAFMREQVCTAICPYGRLQGVLLDKDSIVVAYDWVRGEPREKIKKQAEASSIPSVGGDCIDCKLCVKVCPTGIDIRNGTQLECVNCTACIDECNDVMFKIGREPDLIRYDSYNGISNKKRKIFTPRVIAYSAVLMALLIGNIAMITMRKDVEINLFRTQGTTYTMDEQGIVRNSYTVKCLNKSTESQTFTFKIDDPKATLSIIGKHISTAPGETYSTTIIITKHQKDLVTYKSEIPITVIYNDKTYEDELPFLGPFK
jgi:cytochrome c oxidase accessory protein FixG